MIVYSDDGHSRAWCAPSTQKVGRPSCCAAATSSAISMPNTSRPSSVGSGKRIIRARFGWSVASFCRSVT